MKIKLNMDFFMLIFLCRLAIALSLSTSCSALESSADLTNFNKVWKDFMSSEDISDSQIGHENPIDYEFALLEDFSDQQSSRYRPYIESIDRHEDCRPYSENKITLLDGTEMSASLVRLPQHTFVATQAPFKMNRHLFWQMILENEIDQLVMLTELVEMHNPTRELACSYWPEKINEKLTLENGLEITLVEENKLLSEFDEHIQIRKFNLHDQKINRTVTHYWYRNWMDQTAPNQKETILTLINKVGHDKALLKSNSPILVHCSGGVGRTGVFIALYHLMQKEKNEDQQIDLFNLIAYLRWQRPFLVGALSQYHFCYKMSTMLHSKKN